MTPDLLAAAKALLASLDGIGAVVGPGATLWKAIGDCRAAVANNESEIERLRRAIQLVLSWKIAKDVREVLEKAMEAKP